MSGTTRVEKKLGSGTLVVLRPISFAAWRGLREKLMDLLTEQMVGGLQRIAQGPLVASVRQQLADSEKRRLLGEVNADPPNGIDVLRAVLDEFERGTVQTVGEVARRIGTTLADMSDDFVRGCIEGTVPDAITAAEWMELRDEAFKLSDPKALLEQEKNFVRGVGNVLGQLLSSSLSTPPGGSESST